MNSYKVTPNLFTVTCFPICPGYGKINVPPFLCHWMNHYHFQYITETAQYCDWKKNKILCYFPICPGSLQDWISPILSLDESSPVSVLHENHIVLWLKKQKQKTLHIPICSRSGSGQDWNPPILITGWIIKQFQYFTKTTRCCDWKKTTSLFSYFPRVMARLRSP